VGEYRLKTLMHKLQVKPYRKLFQEMWLRGGTALTIETPKKVISGMEYFKMGESEEAHEISAKMYSVERK
jgi:hypothetical protein